LCDIYGVIVADEGAHGFQIRAIGIFIRWFENESGEILSIFPEF